MNPVFLIPLLPLAGFVFAGLVGRRLGKGAVATACCAVMAIAFGLSLWLFAGYDGSPQTVVAWEWMAAGELTVPIAFRVDALSLVMLLVVTGVGSLIHVYSIGYMHHDEGFARYFAYLNLFVFFMLVLVLADSMPLLFVGWEGVGLCSYLLIGFWYQRPSAADAGLKAFLVNRVGDFGYVLAMIAAFAVFGTLSFAAINAAAPEVAANDGVGALRWIALLLFFAATGKSAQFPLYVWLPDAMEGPSPVSALIHAATMVTSGVYLLVRLYPLFSLVPDVLLVVALVGAWTALMAATMGVVATDIKKVLAYSTISQLGYMFLGLGVGAFAASMFHLVTHAFFKACLFLGAGAVMHALADETDMRKMGGLSKKIKLTWATMLVATLAIVGFPGLSGFVSKDAILLGAWEAAGHGGLAKAVFVLGWITVGLTAFYMFRLIFMTFHGERRVDQQVWDHAHDATPSMAFALVPLAILSVVGGVLNWPHAFGGHASFSAFVESAVPLPAGVGAGGEHHLTFWQEVVFSLGIAAPALVCAVVAWRLYRRDLAPGERWAERLRPLYRLFDRKWYVDDLYDWAVVRGLKRVSRFARAWIDEILIDGLVNLTGLMAQVAGEILRAFQTGLVRNYALFVATGTAAILVWVVLR